MRRDKGPVDLLIKLARRVVGCVHQPMRRMALDVFRRDDRDGENA
jgi:hypothetical protein